VTAPSRDKSPASSLCRRLRSPVACSRHMRFGGLLCSWLPSSSPCLGCNAGHRETIAIAMMRSSIGFTGPQVNFPSNQKQCDYESCIKHWHCFGHRPRAAQQRLVLIDQDRRTGRSDQMRCWRCGKRPSGCGHHHVNRTTRGRDEEYLHTLRSWS